MKIQKAKSHPKKLLLTDRERLDSPFCKGSSEGFFSTKKQQTDLFDIKKYIKIHFL
jgi:hypothetical protein